MEYIGCTYRRIQMPKIGFESIDSDWLQIQLNVGKSPLDLTNATLDK